MTVIPSLRLLKQQDRVLQQLQANLNATISPAVSVLNGELQGVLSGVIAILKIPIGTTYSPGSPLTLTHGLGHEPTAIIPALGSSQSWGFYVVGQPGTVMATLASQNSLTGPLSISFMVF